MEAATPCKNGNEEAFERVAGDRRRNPRFRPNSQKTKHACIVEAHESTRKRLESTLPRSHEDHMAERGFNSMSHYNLVHKFIPMSQGMKIPDAKGAVDEEWETLEK